MKLYQGVVVNNNDPQKIGRVQIRIPFLDGLKEEGTPDSGLDWYEASMAFAAGYQYGSFVVPPVGTILWCGVEDPEAGMPCKVYFGAAHGVGPINSKYFGGKWTPPGVLETPSESDTIYYPNDLTIFKSLQGSNIVFDHLGNIIITWQKSQIFIEKDKITFTSPTLAFNANPDAQVITMKANTVSINAGSVSIQAAVNINGSLTVNGRPVHVL